jgi:hypothetical protein
LGRALILGWAIALDYYALRVTAWAEPDYCPDRFWDSGPRECDWTVFDIALFVSLPLLAAATMVACAVAVIRRLRNCRRLPL